MAAGLILALAAFPGPAQATFGGRDGLVAFGRGEAGAGTFRKPLFTMDPDGTSVRQITSPAWGFADTSPSWSPDGTRVAFERDDLTANNADLYIANADGSGLTRLTDCSAEPGCGGYFGPTWTPDGRSIVFTRCCVNLSDGAHQAIDIMRADGTGLRAITFDPSPNGGDDGATVSPDGRWVAFSRQVTDRFGNAAGSALFLVHPDGTGLQQLTTYGLWVDEKDWSPDGSRIVFVTHAGSVGRPFRADIDTIAPDGSGLTQLTSTIPGQTFAFAPVWAPAGDRIMFDLAGSSGVSVYTMRPDGSDPQQIAGTSGDNPMSWGTAAIR